MVIDVMRLVELNNFVLTQWTPPTVYYRTMGVTSNVKCPKNHAGRERHILSIATWSVWCSKFISSAQLMHVTYDSELCCIESKLVT